LGADSSILALSIRHWTWISTEGRRLYDTVHDTAIIRKSAPNWDPPVRDYLIETMSVSRVHPEIRSALNCDPSRQGISIDKAEEMADLMGSLLGADRGSRWRAETHPRPRSSCTSHSVIRHLPRGLAQFARSPRDLNDTGRARADIPRRQRRRLRSAFAKRPSQQIRASCSLP
jgi:hypothetical protein